MKDANAKRLQRPLIFLAFFVIIAVLTTLVYAATRSSYFSKVSGQDVTKVAAARLYFLEGEPSLRDIAPGETKWYEFRVTNAQAEDVSQVALQYFFDFSGENPGTKPLDLSYDLYYKANADAEPVRIGMRQNLPNRSNSVEIAGSESITHTFILEVTWNATQMSADDYANVASRIAIDTYVEQVG